MIAAGHPIIALEGIRKVFVTGDVETHALAEIDMEIQSGEYVAIAGPSGCGKSTLLSILGLLDAPTAGSYTLNGRRVEELSARERAWVRNREVGFVFQSFNLIGDLTILDNVQLPLAYRGTPRSDRRLCAEAALRKVNMTARMMHYPIQLSGGEQQRVAVARALVGQPSILLADEPTGNLDSANGHTVMELLDKLHAKGATICLVTHDPQYAARAQRTVHLFDGMIVHST